MLKTICFLFILIGGINGPIFILIGLLVVTSLMVFHQLSKLLGVMLYNIYLLIAG